MASDSLEDLGQTRPKKFQLSYRALPGWFVPAFAGLGITLFAIALAGNTSDTLIGLTKAVNRINNRGVVALFQPEGSTQSSLVPRRIAPPDLAIGDPELEWVPVTPEQLQNDAQAGDRLSALLLILGTFSCVLAFAGKDKRLSMDESGITFPKAMAASLGWKLKRGWSELSALMLVRKTASASCDDTTDQEIELMFTTGKARIKCGRLSKAELESFFQSLDDLAPHCIRSPELVAFRHKMFSDKSEHSFTQLWEEELASHFAATNFVALTPGQKLQNGKIKITMHLSSGGLSAVYLAEYGKTMAIVKESVVPPGTSEANREKASQMFQREATLLMRLEHAQIAKVFDHFQDQGRDYLLLEYIPGVTLREYIKRHGPQSEEKVTNWTKQLADILDYLHGQDPPIIHRDITPDNLIITPDGRIVLIDFGAANQFLGAATGTIIGKQFYIAPEQFRGKAEPASDIYSLGGTVFYLLTGKDPEALMRSNPKAVNDKLSRKIDRIVAQCTEPELGKRIRSTKDLLASLNSDPEQDSDSEQDSEPSRSDYESGATVSLEQSKLNACAAIPTAPSTGTAGVPPVPNATNESQGAQAISIKENETVYG